jgi:hypothetical protein
MWLVKKPPSFRLREIFEQFLHFISFAVIEYLYSIKMVDPDIFMKGQREYVGALGSIQEENKNKEDIGLPKKKTTPSSVHPLENTLSQKPEIYKPNPTLTRGLLYGEYRSSRKLYNTDTVRKAEPPMCCINPKPANRLFMVRVALASAE